MLFSSIIKRIYLSLVRKSSFGPYVELDVTAYSFARKFSTYVNVFCHFYVNQSENPVLSVRRSIAFDRRSLVVFVVLLTLLQIISTDLQTGSFVMLIRFQNFINEKFELEIVCKFGNSPQNWLFLSSKFCCFFQSSFFQGIP